MFYKVQLGFIVCVLAGLVASRAQQPAPASAPAQAGATMQAGQIHAVRIRGDVSKAFGDTRAALKENDAVEEKATVTTGQNGTVVLVFSNGATTQLGPDTVLSIDQYLQDPFKEAEVKVAELTEEPTRSNTRLRLTKGELVGKVVHLHHDQGSTFEVQTPVGAAGIRGTTFRIVFRPTGTGQAFNFQLSTVEGSVNFQQGGTNAPGGGPNGAQGQGQPQNQNQNPNQPAQGGAGNQGGNTGPTPPPPPGGGGGTGNGLAVTGGQEIVVIVSATVSPTGTVTITAPPTIASTAPISTTTQTQITAAAQQIVTAAATVVFQAPTTTVTGTTQTGGTSGNSNQQQQQDSSQQNQNQQNQQQGSSNSSSTNGNTGTTGNNGNSNTTGNTGTTGSNGTTGTTGTTGSTTNNGNTGNTNRQTTPSNLVSSPPPTTPTPRVTTGDGRPGT